MNEIDYEIGSGNVFADLGVEKPTEALAKAELARKISSIIKQRRLKQVAAADLLAIDQPKISRLMRGQLNEFSLEKLLHFLTQLDHDIEIVIKKKPSTHEKGDIAVSTG